MKTPWPALETIPGLIALPISWRNKIGEHFENFSALCLRPSQWLPRSYPCPRDPGCAFRILPVAHASQITCQDSFIGICERCPPECPNLTLTRADITPLELNWEKLARALCQALGLDTKISKLQIPHTIQIGSWSADAVPVLLTIQTERRHFRHAVCELIARLHQRFILLAPTSQHFDALCQELLSGANAALFPLESIVTLTPNGNLLPTKTPGELFAKFAPEEKLPEDAALRAFAILKSMDTDTPVRKASVFSVFRLYCMENLSAEQVAKRLRCSKGSVINRLALIRQKTGVDPEKLRAYSAQFTGIEQSLSDSRAPRISRQTATEDSDSE